MGDHSSTTQLIDDDDLAALLSTSTAPPTKKIHLESVLYGCFDRRKSNVTDDSQLPISVLVKKYLDYVRSAPTGVACCIKFTLIQEAHASLWESFLCTGNLSTCWEGVQSKWLNFAPTQGQADRQNAFQFGFIEVQFTHRLIQEFLHCLIACH